MDSPTERVTRSARKAGATGKVVPEPTAASAGGGGAKGKGRSPLKTKAVASTPSTASTTTTSVPVPVHPSTVQNPNDANKQFVPIQPAQTQSNPIFIIQMQQPNPQTIPQNITVPISSVGSFPTIVSSESLQNTSLNLGTEKTGNYFTVGRNANDVVAMFQTFSIYLTNNLSGFAPNWHHAITTGSRRTDYTLNIYELKSSLLGLSLPRTIQMFMDQTIRILIHSKDGTKDIIGDCKVETPENLKELIMKIRRTSLCSGCRDFDDVNISSAKGVKEGKTWYSIHCNRLVTLKSVQDEDDVLSYRNSTKNRMCKDCAQLKLALGRQACRRRKRMAGKSEPTSKVDKGNPTREKLNVRNIIQERLESVWSSLGFDEAARKWKEEHLAKTQKPTTHHKEVQKSPSSNSVTHVRSPLRPATEIQPETVDLDSDTEELMDI